jgi:hypothetical protein
MEVQEKCRFAAGFGFGQRVGSDSRGKCLKIDEDIVGGVVREE